MMSAPLIPLIKKLVTSQQLAVTKEDGWWWRACRADFWQQNSSTLGSQK
jgi:hypothetical protein